jgi:pimeloyl-ACP methyl ester carboxylesterase
MSGEGAPLHTLSYGDQGSRVLFLHGLFGQGRNWSTIGRALAESHRVTLVDLLHHGRSPWRDRFDYREVAASVAELIEERDPAAVVGHSMGGKVAMVLALTRPELVERLVVADIAPVSTSSVTGFDVYTSAMQELDLSTLASRDDADRKLAARVPDPGVRAFLLQNLRRQGQSWSWQMNLDVLTRDLGVIGGWPDLAGSYGGPVLWLAGERSDYVRPEHDATMRGYFPKVRKVVVKGAGHWLHSDQPAVVTEILRQFLSRSPADRAR